jgi:hypothetical protein
MATDLEALKLERLRYLKHLRDQAQAREAAKYAGIDVFKALEYVPTPKQQLFHAATEFDVLYGGAAGGGKSKALVMHAIRESVRHPGLRTGLFRRTYGELKESLVAELANVSFARAVGASWNGTDWDLKFPNGSVMMFRYAESLQDATRRQGGQYQLLCFDERTLTPPDVVAFLYSRLRSGRADVPVLGIRSGTNPGGPGHGAVKDRFVDATAYGENVILDDRGRTVRFIPSKLADNPHVNPEYAADLQALPEQMRKAFLDGDWDSFLGQAFATWSRELHTLAPITLPPTWRRFVGIDWGYSAPWAVLWGAVDEDGRVWIYRQLYARQVGEAEQARRILSAETATEAVLARYADDAMWATRGDALPISTVYAQNGVYLTPAGKGGRVTGWQRVRSYLELAPACAHHRAQGWDRCPMMHVFTSVTDLIRTLPALPSATTGDPEDIDTKAEDHLADALRYMLLNLGGGAQFPVDDVPEAVDHSVVEAGTYAAVNDPALPFDWPDAESIQRTHGVRILGEDGDE